MKTSVGNTRIEVATGDITQLEVDAIANAANTELWMDDGVAGAIKRAGGEAVEMEAMLQGPIEVGEAVVTTGHDLKARWVIHVAVMGQDLHDRRRRHRHGHPQHAGTGRSHARPLRGPAGLRHGRGRLPAVPVRQHHGRRDRALPQGPRQHRACAPSCSSSTTTSPGRRSRTPWPASAASKAMPRT